MERSGRSPANAKGFQRCGESIALFRGNGITLVEVGVLRPRADNWDGVLHEEGAQSWVISLRAALDPALATIGHDANLVARVF